MKSYEKEINGKFVIKLAEEKDIRDVTRKSLRNSYGMVL